MMSFKSIGSGADASASASYYENLAKEDYYTEGGEPPGMWFGLHSVKLGLNGEQVEVGQLKKAFEGFHPITNQALANNAGDAHKAGYDFVFSAPKSVSTVWATADNDTRKDISFAQQKAVEKAIKYAEQNAFHTRAGHAGAHHLAHKDGVVAAAFEHSTSREGDPQLHTHAIILNLTQDGKRLDFDSNWKMSIGAAYRVELANELQKMGYTIARDGSSFEIKGVPQELQRELSTRRQQIEQALKEKGLTGNAKAASIAALDTRQAKGEVNREQLVQESRELAKEYGFTQETAQGLRTDTVAAIYFDRDKFTQDLTQNASTVTEQQLQAQYFQAMQGVGSSIDESKAQLNQIKINDLVELVDTTTGESRWTTEEMLAIETAVSEMSERMSAEETHEVSDENLQKAIARKNLSDEQRTALAHITKPERIAVVSGVAGAGKSYMLDAARDVWESQGYEVVGVALSGKAAEGLQESAGINSDTIHKTLIQLENGDIHFTKNTVVVMDEAGMTGSRLMHDLQSRIDAAGAKLVLVGDTRQLQPVDAGGAMRAIQSKVGAVEMNEIRRQQDPKQREIVKDFAEGHTSKAIEKLENLGQVKTYETAKDANKAIAKSTINDLNEGKTSIALAGTRSEVKAINEEIRSAAKEASIVKGDDKAFATEKGTRQFAEGDRVIFLQNDRQLGVRNGTTGSVEKAEDGKLHVKTDNGKHVDVDQTRYNKIDYGYAYTVHKSQGITVDRAHYQPGQMNDKELSYVAGSRHRDTFTVHTTKEGLDEFKKSSERSHAKDTSADYQIKNRDLQKHATRHESKLPHTNAPASNRLERSDHNVARDADLAKRALETKGRMPEAKEIRKDIEKGNASWTRDSQGDRYLQYRNGKTYNPQLHTNNKETNLKQMIGEKRAIIVDKHLVDIKVLGHRIQAIKTGTQVLISRDTVRGKVAGAMKDMMQESRQAKSRTPKDRTVVDKIKYKIEQKLNQGEGYRKATLQEAVRARISVKVENKLSSVDAKSRLQAKVEAARSKEPQGKTITADNKKSAEKPQPSSKKDHGHGL